MPRIIGLILVCALWLAAFACGAPLAAFPPSGERGTQLAATAAAILTGTATARIVSATPTSLPTTTPVVLSTRAPTRAPTATPTLGPTVTGTPTACQGDDSDFVGDVNVPDGTHFGPGAPFVKTWRLLNSGSCTWTTAYTLRFVEGEPMSGQPVPLPHDVPPGATIDLSVALVAPANSGTFISRWQLHNPAAIAFGTRPYVQIIVP